MPFRLPLDILVLREQNSAKEAKKKVTYILIRELIIMEGKS